MARENLPLHFWSLWLHSAHPHWQHLDAGWPLKPNWKITHVWIQGPQLVLISPPRPWFGRPVRPTIEPPRALLSGTLDLEVRIMIASNFLIRWTCVSGTRSFNEAESEDDALCLQVRNHKPHFLESFLFSFLVTWEKKYQDRGRLVKFNHRNYL